MEPPTQENTAEGETLEMLLMKYNWAHDQLKDVAPANQKKKKVKKKNPLEHWIRKKIIWR